MSQTFEANLSLVRNAISKRPPFVSGTHGVPEDDLKLYFGDAGNAHCMNLGRATEAELNALSSACQPATFGLNQRDVLDETYRKAGKLDTTMFASLFKVADCGLINAIHNGLLRDGMEATKQITCELYKLNVYGKGSFFKPHQDTPRSEKMFGSLVVVFPTPHEGGALVLREGGREWTFDYSAELAASKDARKIAYIAFFGDIEHEVLPVTSGHRVTLTYNLYFDRPPAGASAQGISVISSSMENEDAQLRAALQELLRDPALLPSGGYMAFGLRFMYPLSCDQPLQDMLPHMKGGDATVVRVCQALGLEGRLKIVYEEINSEREDVAIVMEARPGAICLEGSFGNEVVDYGGEHIRAMGSLPIDTDFCVWSKSSYMDVLPTTEVLWITELTELNRVEQEYFRYGNGPSVDCVYGHLAYFVGVRLDKKRPSSDSSSEE